MVISPLVLGRGFGFNLATNDESPDRRAGAFF
jgi:hypothetical protein